MRSILPCAGEDHLRLDRLEVDRAALFARLQQLVEQLVEMLQMRHDRGIALCQLAVRFGQHRGDLVIGQARLGMHHRRIEAVAFDVAAAADMHVAHHAQSIHMRVQRTQAVGQLLRQHRDHAARKIHRVAAVDRLAVQRIAGLHVMADVGDRHHQAVTAFFRRAIHRVVEIARGLAVYRDQRQAADVLASLPVVRGNHRGDRLGLALGILGKLIGQVMLAQCDLDLHARIGIIAQYLDDAADRLRVLVGVLHDLQHHHLPYLGCTGLAGSDQDVLGDAAVLGHDELNAVLFIQAADHAVVGAFQHLDDLALGPPAPVHAALPHHHDVAVQHLVHLLLAEEHVRATIFRDQEAESVRVALHLTLDQVELVHHADRALAVAHDLAVALHCAQAARKQVFFIRFDVQQFQQFFICNWRTLLGKYLQDEFAAGQRLLVLLAFAFQERVLQTYIFFIFH